jgi:hypothetical protein
MKTDKIVSELLDHARLTFQEKQDWAELGRLLDDPMLINNKEMALFVCTALIRGNIERGSMKEDSIMHRLGLRLMDYIGRAA